MVASLRSSIRRFQSEAALQSAHVHRCRSGRGNWGHVPWRYDALLALSGLPTVAINRAVAIAERDGAAVRRFLHARQAAVGCSTPRLRT